VPPKGIRNAFFMYETIRLWVATIILVYLTNSIFLTSWGLRKSKPVKSYGSRNKGIPIDGTSMVWDTLFIQNGLDLGLLHSTIVK